MPAEKYQGALGRFYADVGLNDPATAGSNGLYARTAKLQQAPYEKLQGTWDDDARYISEIVGMANDPNALNFGDKGLPIPSTEVGKYRIVSGYGWRKKPGPRHHHGIDISPTAGASLNLVAAMSGTVVSAGWVAGYGHTLTIRADDTFRGQPLFLFYAHLASYAQGLSRVVQGQQIAVMGKTGGSNYPVHLHFEVRVGRNDKTATWNPLVMLPILKKKLAQDSDSVTEFDNYVALFRAYPTGAPPRSDDESA